MEHRIEQTISRENGAVSAVFYGFCRIAAPLMLVFAALCASGMLEEGADGALHVRWLSLALTLLLLALAACAFWGKDHLRTEYDYCLCGHVLEVSRILNGKRRSRAASIELGKVFSAGCASSAAFQRIERMSGMKKLRCTLHKDAKQYYFAYEQNGNRLLALLELNDALLAAVRRNSALARDAWQTEEGMDRADAGVS